MLAIIALFIYFISILLFLMNGKQVDSITIVGQTWTSPNINTYMIWYHLTGFIWAYMFMMGISTVTIAGAVGEFYWLADKNSRVGRLPILRSLYRAFRYHLGSIAIGSLLITIVEVIRIMLYQLQRQVAKSKIPALQYLVAAAQCCMKCVEVILKFVNRNAYIYIAIKGKSFFYSAGAATALLLRNAAKLVAVNFVADFCLFLSKLVVAGILSFASYAFLLRYPTYFNVQNLFVPVCFVAFEGFVISAILFSAYHIAIDTVFLSVLEDLDKNDGSPGRPYFMTEGMRTILGKKVILN